MNYFKYLAILACLPFATADQPIKCNKDQGNYVGSVWTMYSTKVAENVNLYEVKQVCSHAHPNQVQIISNDFKWVIPDHEIWKVKIIDQNNVKAFKCPRAGHDCDFAKHKGPTIDGHWDVLYQQALMVQLDDGMRFVANFRYAILPGDAALDSQSDKLKVADKPAYMQPYKIFADLQVNDYHRFSKHCDQTMVGFIQTRNDSQNMTSHKIQCFYGVQNVPTEKVVTKKLKSTSVVQSENQHNFKNYVSKKDLYALYPLKPSAENDAIIMSVNQHKNSSWTANSCLLTTGHKNRPHDCDHKKQSLAKTNETTKTFGVGEDFTAALIKLGSFKKKYATADKIPKEEIPTSFDLRSINGIDFTGKVRNQHQCGSCYTMSFIQVIESRIKSNFGADVGSLSPQHNLQCNYMTEGCDGGWALLNGFFYENSHLVAEECAPYVANTTSLTCSSFSKCPGVARVSKSYEKKHQGELAIQREILRNGAVVVDWYQPPYAETYKTGIFKKAPGDDKQTSMEKAGEVLPNHASVLIGWGVQDDGQKYWILRNSFGEDFAQKGHMLIERGKNTFAIENTIAGFDVELV